MTNSGTPSVLVGTQHIEPHEVSCLIHVPILSPLPFYTIHIFLFLNPEFFLLVIIIASVVVGDDEAGSHGLADTVNICIYIYVHVYIHTRHYSKLSIEMTCNCYYY